MPITSVELSNWFRYHSPIQTPPIEITQDVRDAFAMTGLLIDHNGQLSPERAYEALREAGRQFALVIIALTPPSPDQSAAIRKVREAVMTANAAIACGGR